MKGERIATAMRQPAILAVIWICTLLVLIGTLTKMPGQWHRRDFSHYYKSAWSMRHGIDPYSTNLTPIGAQLGLETNWLVHASETPPFLLCFEPLTRMRPRVAFWIWIAINFSALAIAMYLLLVRRGLSGRTALLLAGLMLMSAPVNLNFYWGQSQLIVLALMVAAMHAMDRERDGTAGLLIAAAALLRAYPLLLVGYFVCRRQWRAVIFATAGIAVGGFATIAILGLSQTLSFIHAALWLTDYRVVNRVDNLSLGPFVSRMFWSLSGTAPGSSADWIRRAAIAAADVVVLGLTIRATLADSDRRDPDWRFYSLWIATAVMLTPVGWHHYLVLLAIPFVQMVVSASEDRSSSRSIWMAALAYFLSAISLRAFSRFMVPPPTAFQLALPWLARALEETSFVALLTGYIAAYWFATDLFRRVPAAQNVIARIETDQNPRALFGSTRTTSSG